MDIHIVTDSTSDLPDEISEKNAVTVVPVYVNMDGKSYLDGVDLSRNEFYRKLPATESLPTTSAPGIGTFVETYQALAAKGAKHIISIHISSTLSNIHNVARLAAEAVEGIDVTVIDSGQLTLGLGLVVLEAARLASEGHPLDETLAAIEDYKERTHSYALLDTVVYLERGGRITSFQQNLATFLSIKPLLLFHKGEMIMEKIRTRKKAVERMLSHAFKLGKLEKVALVHANSLERLEIIREKAQDVFREIEVPFSGEVTPAIGSHVGPGSIGLVCVVARQE